MCILRPIILNITTPLNLYVRSSLEVANQHVQILMYESFVVGWERCSCWSAFLLFSATNMFLAFKYNELVRYGWLFFSAIYLKLQTNVRVSHGGFASVIKALVVQIWYGCSIILYKFAVCGIIDSVKLIASDCIFSQAYGCLCFTPNMYVYCFKSDFYR